jgi:hypothetical protein
LGRASKVIDVLRRNLVAKKPLKEIHGHLCGSSCTIICYDELVTTLKDKVEMGLTKEPIELPSREDVNLLVAKDEVDSPKSNKLPFEKTLAHRVHAMAGMVKRYSSQVTLFVDSKLGFKEQTNPSSKQGQLWIRVGISFMLEEAMEVDEVMRLITEKGGVKGIVAKKDALHETLEKVQAQLLASKEKEVTRLEGTLAQHFANYIKLSQEVKIAELLLSIADHVKLVLDNWVQTLERELLQKGVKLDGGTTCLKGGTKGPPSPQR